MTTQLGSPRVSRLGDAVKAQRCEFGLIMYVASDSYIGRSLAAYGEFSSGEQSLFAQVVKRGDTVVDAGSNIGCHTIFLSRQVGSEGHVHAFEPQRKLYYLLCGNVALNGCDNVVCHQKGLGATDGTLFVPRIDYSRAGNFGGVSLSELPEGEQVEVITLDELELHRCDFIKVDVEGMEREVLLGAEETIRRHAPILYVENDRTDRSEALIAYVDSLGYDLYWHCPPLFNPNNYTGNPENIFGNIVSRNMFCLPRCRPYHAEGFRRIDVK